MKKFIVIFAVLLCLSVSLHADEKYIVLEDIEGEGKDRNTAIEAAWLTGIRQAVGSFIDSKSELNNDQLTERIIAYSRGLIARYEVTGVDDTRAAQGIYKVKTKLWIVQELLRDGAEHAVTQTASISFSQEDLIRQQKEELDAKNLEAINAAEETAKMKAKTGAELLSAMLDRYKPEDFLICYIPGKPAPVKDKTDFFSLNVEINFNDKLYREKFIPDLIQVLDQIASVKKNTMLVKYKNEFRNMAAKKMLSETSNSVIFKTDGLGKNDFTLAVYNKPERFGVRLYGFEEEDVNAINAVLSSFINKTARVQGIVLELQDEDKETIETIEEKINLRFLMTSDGKDLFAVHPTILKMTRQISYGTRYQETKQIVNPVELEMPQEVLPYVKEIKVSLLLGEPPAPKKAWLGINFYTSSTRPRISSFPEGSPAKAAGLKVNADFISVNGKQVRTPGEVQKIIDTLYAGDIVMIKTDYGDAQVVLGAAPEK